MKLHSMEGLPTQPPTPLSIITHTHPQTHTEMQMCLLAMKKLSVLICSLRPEDKSDHGDGGPPLPLPSCLSNRPFPQLVATGPVGAQVAPEGSPLSQQAALNSTMCSPNVPDARRPDTLLQE